CDSDWASHDVAALARRPALAELALNASAASAVTTLEPMRSVERRENKMKSFPGLGACPLPWGDATRCRRTPGIDLNATEVARTCVHGLAFRWQPADRDRG